MADGCMAGKGGQAPTEAAAAAAPSEAAVPSEEADANPAIETSEAPARLARWSSDAAHNGKAAPAAGAAASWRAPPAQSEALPGNIAKGGGGGPFRGSEEWEHEASVGAAGGAGNASRGIEGNEGGRRGDGKMVGSAGEEVGDAPWLAELNDGTSGATQEPLVPKR